jgi:hypothetical protein
VITQLTGLGGFATGRDACICRGDLCLREVIMMNMRAAAMETSLLASAGAEAEMREATFKRFHAGGPDRRRLFLNPAASEARMLDEALGWMLGAVAGEGWVGPQVADLVYQHGGYGRLTAADYMDFLDAALAALEVAAGEAWGPAAAGWQEGRRRVAAMIAETIAAWEASPLGLG